MQRRGLKYCGAMLFLTLRADGFRWKLSARVSSLRSTVGSGAIHVVARMDYRLRELTSNRWHG
jgi:hypothetical protein